MLNTAHGHASRRPRGFLKALPKAINPKRQALARCGRMVNKKLEADAKRNAQGRLLPLAYANAHDAGKPSERAE